MRYLLAVCVIVSVVSAPTQTSAQDRNREEPAAAIPIDLKDPDQVLEYTSKLQIEYEKALCIANTAVRDREKEKADRNINALLGKVVRVHTKIKLLPKPYGVRSTGLSRRLPVKISDEVYVLTGVAFDIYNFAGDRNEGRPILSVPRADISLEDFEKLTGEEEGVCEGKIISFEPTARGEFRYRTFVIEGRFVTSPNGKPVKRENVIPARGRWRGTLVYDDGEARNASLEFAGGEHTYHEQDQEF